jgi:ribose 5-phosphate isomerase B
MHIGIAADHGGFALKEQIATSLKAAGHELIDYGTHELAPEDDYPDYIVPLEKAKE